MMYEAYEKKVRGYIPLVRLCKICVMCAVLLLILGVVLLFGYLSLRGIHFGDYTLQSETVAFGDKPEYDCFVLFGTYKCEYAPRGSDDWSKQQPTQPGTYEVRAVISRGFFGRKIYSEAGTITLYRRDVTLYPESKFGSTVEYGGDPAFGKHWQIPDSLLAKGHSVDEAALSYFTYDGHGGAICHIDPSSVVIRDKKGNDVTAGYALNFSQGTIKVKAKQITVVVAEEIKNGKPVNITKVYDGQSAGTSHFEVTKGELISGDQIFVTPHGVTADVGRHENRVTVTVTNQAEQDRTAYYDIKIDACKVVIEKRPITVKTPDVSLEYSGERQYTDAYQITSGSVVQGQRVDLVHNDKTGVIDITTRPQDNKVQLQIISGGEDVTKNYDISYEYGSLTMSPRTLQVRTDDSYGLVYNGTAQSYTSYEITKGSLGYGHYLSPKNQATQTVPGSCENRVEYRILSGDGKDVTKNYNFSVTYGTLTVERGAPLTLSLKSLEKTYDAAPLDPADYSAEQLISVLGGTLFKDDYIEIVNTHGSQTDAGSSSYSVSYRIMHKEGLGKTVDATDWYASDLSGEGLLSVSKRTLDIKFDPITKKYDGQPTIPSTPNLKEASISKFEGKGHKIVLASGAMQHLSYTSMGQYVPEAISIGSYSYTIPVEMISVVLDDGRGADRTHNYEFRFSGNTIKIEGTTLTLTAPSSSKQYDGTPLQAEDFSLSDVKEVWEIDGYHATYTLVGGQQNAGTSNLSIQNVEVWDRNGNNVTQNFHITIVPGKLTVTPISIQVRSSSGNKVYDGAPLDNATQMTLISGNLIPGHVLGGSVKSDYITDVGTHENSRITPKVYTSSGQDVSANYLITVAPGRYTITPATLYINAPVVKGEYTGQPYSGTCDATSSAQGLVRGQKVELDVVSNGADLGKHRMTVKGYNVVDARGRDVTGNYDITCSNGEIEIVPRKITIITGNSTVEYTNAPAVNTQISVGGSGLLDGHDVRATFTYPDGIASVGTTQLNTLDNIRVVNQSGKDVSRYYDISTSYGTLHVKPIAITLETGSAYKETYDGQPIIATVFELIKGSILPEHLMSVEFEYDEGVCDVGKWKNELSSIRFRTVSGTDVSYVYDVTVIPGTLEIANPYVLPMQSFDAEKVYDGKALSNEDYALLGELLPGHEVAGVKPVALDLVGEKENRLSLTILDQNGRDVSRNYAFYYEEGTLGTLRVTHRPMTVTVPEHVVLTYSDTTKLPIPQNQLQCPGLVVGQRVVLPITVESPEIGYKYDCELGDLRIYDTRGRDVTHCYYITLVDQWQSVVIEPAELTLYLPARYYKEYDGTGVNAAQVGYRAIGFVTGHVVTYQANEAPAQPGTYTLQFSGWTVYDQSGNDVTANYIVTPSTCSVTISKVYIRLESESASRHYNGEALTHPVLKPYKLSGDFTIEPVFTGSQTEVGRSDNTFYVIVYDRNGNDITEYIDTSGFVFGKLEVWGDIALTLKSGSLTAIYDGTAHVCYELEPYELPAGYELVDLVFTGSQTEPGTSKNLFSARIIDTRTGEDATDAFDITWEEGDLTVVRAEDWEVNLKSKDAFKSYDGSPLTMPELEPYELPDGFRLADLVFTGSQTALGTSLNTFTARAVNDAGQELRVICEYGTLAVTLDIAVTPYEQTFTYDGTEKKCGSNDYWVQGLPADGRYQVVAEIADRGLETTGSIDIVFRNVVVYDTYTGEDVTEACNLTKNTAKLTVRPRTLTVYVYGQSEDSIEPVQGSLLSNHQMFAEYGEDGNCYIEIADKNTGMLVYSNRGDTPVRYTLYEVIIQYG